MNTRDIIDTVEARRKELGMTQEALAQAAGVSRRTLTAFLSGKAQIGIRRLLRLATALQLSLSLTPRCERPTEAELAGIFRED
jgi:transcriptional regulator with XRE-family HTH domain